MGLHLVCVVVVPLGNVSQIIGWTIRLCPKGWYTTFCHHPCSFCRKPFVTYNSLMWVQQFSFSATLLPSLCIGKSKCNNCGHFTSLGRSPHGSPKKNLIHFQREKKMDHFKIMSCWQPNRGGNQGFHFLFLRNSTNLLKIIKSSTNSSSNKHYK
jgi:hypothetical protein